MSQVSHGIFDNQFTVYFPENPAASRAAHKSFAGKSGPIVHFTKDLSLTGLVAVYKKFGMELLAKCGVRISTDESGGRYFLNPKFVADLVHIEHTAAIGLGSRSYRLVQI